MIQKVKRFVQSTMGLLGTEANAFLLILPLLFIVIFSEPLYRFFAKNNLPLKVQETIYLDSLVAQIEEQKPIVVKDSFSLVAFDPNKSTENELTALGIPSRISKRIIQYRSKGGTFRIKSDLGKMYGMDSSLYRSLLPFISLPDKIEKQSFAKTEKEIKVIQYDINLTDTASLKSVRGIGSVLAKRIIKYRDGLGGFVGLHQLKEIFGLDSLTIVELGKFYIANGFEPKQIAINRATEKELDAHPYLSGREAKSILTFKAQHGNYSSIVELMKIKSLNQQTVSKIEPYLSYE